MCGSFETIDSIWFGESCWGASLAELHFQPIHRPSFTGFQWRLQASFCSSHGRSALVVLWYTHRGLFHLWPELLLGLLETTAHSHHRLVLSNHVLRGGIATSNMDWLHVSLLNVSITASLRRQEETVIVTVWHNFLLRSRIAWHR